MVGCAGAMLLVFILAVVLRIVLVLENRKRSKVYDADAAVHAGLLQDGQEVHERQERFVLML